MESAYKPMDKPKITQSGARSLTHVRLLNLVELMKPLILARPFIENETQQQKPREVILEESARAGEERIGERKGKESARGKGEGKERRCAQILPCQYIRKEGKEK